MVSRPATRPAIGSRSAFDSGRLDRRLLRPDVELPDKRAELRRAQLELLAHLGPAQILGLEEHGFDPASHVGVLERPFRRIGEPGHDRGGSLRWDPGDKPSTETGQLQYVDGWFERKYSNYMKRDPLPASQRKPAKVELKVVQIGNSRGVRLPKAVLDRYEIKDALVLEAREEGLLLRGKKDKRMTWEETFRDMARENEDWSDLDATVADGIDPGEKW